MYERKKRLKEEGLFITEFNNNFFEDFLKNNNEIEELIQDIENLSKKYKTKYQEKGKRDGKDATWHFIITAALKKIKEYRPEIQVDLDDSFLAPQLKYIVSEFYSEQLFLEFDVAQKIEYNLYRCTKEEHDMYNLGGNEEGTEDDYKIIWDEYGALFSSGRKMEDKDPAIDLLPGIQRLEPPKSKVCFSGCLDGENLFLESDFASLNFLYLANEKFQKFLGHEEKSQKYFDNLLEFIEILNKNNEIPLHYIWEKMTNFNAANIISKFVVDFTLNGKFTIEAGYEFIESISVGSNTLLSQIEQMPNILTRLIFLKKIFFAISVLYKHSTLWEISRGQLCVLRDILKSINKKYLYIQGAVLELSVITYWRLNKEQGEKLDIEKWIGSIKKEYSFDSFQKLLVNSSLKEKFIEEEVMHINTIRNEKLKIFPMEFDAIHYKYVSISDIEKCFGNKIYSENINDLVKEIQKKGWFTIESGYDIREGKFKYQHNEICCTETYNDEEEEKIYDILKTKNDSKHIKNFLRQYLLSGYKNVIFENTDIKEKNKYINIFNFLLYHMR